MKLLCVAGGGRPAPAVTWLLAGTSWMGNEFYYRLLKQKKTIARKCKWRLRLSRVSDKDLLLSIMYKILIEYQNKKITIARKCKWRLRLSRVSAKDVVQAEI